MQLVEVTTRRHVKEFLRLPVRLYKGEKNWIRPLDQDIEQVFDPKKNKKFRHGEAIRWILQRDGRTVGRVAAFVDRKTAEKDNKQPTGGMGFFECENDREAAFALFDACKQWLEARQMQAMDGPVNFGDRDRWWGLLIDGSDHEPNYCMGYHFGYYKDLFEAYGFQEYFKQYTYGRDIGKSGISDALWERAQRVIDNPSYRFEHMKRGKVLEYMEDFRTIYNKAWAAHPGVPKMTKVEVEAIAQQFKPIIDVQIIWFAYYENEPVAFFIQIPEMNQVFKRVNGKLFTPVGLANFVWHQYVAKTNRKIFGVVFGVVPEHQRKGVEAALVKAFSTVAYDQKFQYREIEMNWIGDFNPVMMKLCQQIGCQIKKTHATYRYLFDRSQPFERARRIKR